MRHYPLPGTTLVLLALSLVDWSESRFRGVLIRWEKKIENYLGLLHLACAWITYRAADPLG